MDTCADPPDSCPNGPEDYDDNYGFTWSVQASVPLTWWVTFSLMASATSTRCDSSDFYIKDVGKDGHDHGYM